MDNCRMITTESLDPRGDDIKRNPKTIEELEVKEVRLFGAMITDRLGLGRTYLLPLSKS